MPKEANVKKQGKEKKHAMKDFKAELKRVSWPTTKQLANNTLAVIIIVLVTAVIVFALDFTFEKMNEYGINKLKSVVESNNEVEENSVEETTDDANIVDTNSEAVTNETADENNAVNE